MNKYEAIQNLEKKTKTATTEFGTIKFFEFDGPIGDAIAVYGEWAGNEIAFAKQFIPPGSTVIDGGANIGTHTMAFSRFCGKDGKLISIEASPDIFQILEENRLNNKLDNVQCINGAISDKSGQSYIERFDGSNRINTGSLRIHEDNIENASKVENIKLDDLSLSALDFLKLDIEGDELKAIAGCINAICRFKPVIMIELISHSVGKTILKELKSFGYNCYYCEFDVYRKNNYNLNSENIFGLSKENSLLFVPNNSNQIISQDGAKIIQIENEGDMHILLETSKLLNSDINANESTKWQIIHEIIQNVIMQQFSERNNAVDIAAAIQNSPVFSSVKVDIADLKAAVLNRVEDRSSIILRIKEIATESQNSVKKISNIEENFDLISSKITHNNNIYLDIERKYENLVKDVDKNKENIDKVALLENEMSKVISENAGLKKSLYELQQRFGIVENRMKDIHRTLDELNRTIHETSVRNQSKFANLTNIFNRKG